jgi:phosphoribosyl 1,2-cyclic phosphate phosphodiesterase
MKLTFLGTGTSSGVPMIGCSCEVCRSSDPHDQRLRSAALVEAEGRALLIDAGPDLRQQLLRTGTQRLDAVLLTHSHMDHIAGIDDLRSLNFHGRSSVKLYGDRRTLDAVRRVFSYAFEADKYPGTPELDLIEVGSDPFRIGSLEIVPIEVRHYRMPVLGFRIGGLGYITDAKSIAPAEMDKIRDCEVLVLNALRRKEHISHLTLDEALAIVKEVKPRRAFFTHISHQLGLHRDVNRELPENVALAHDGLVVEL